MYITESFFKKSHIIIIWEYRNAVRRGRGEESGGRPARLGRAGELDSLPRLVPQGLSSGVA